MSTVYISIVICTHSSTITKSIYFTTQICMTEFSSVQIKKSMKMKLVKLYTTLTIYTTFTFAMYTHTMIIVI